MSGGCDPGKGFADAVFDAQAVFRRVQDALARPGSVHCLARAGLVAPAGMPLGIAAFLLTLADHETPVWLRGGQDHPAAYWLSFHTGARVVAAPEVARFAVIENSDDTPAMAAFSAGEDRYPDRSATLLFACRDFRTGPRVRLEGPGIKEHAEVTPAGLRACFWEEVRANARRFPLGVDLFLIADADAIGLPRTVRIAAAMEAASCTLP